MTLKRMIGTILFACLIYAEAAKANPAPTPSATPSPEPLVTITSPRSATVKKYALFPLEIPAYVMRGITWPFIQGIRLVEKKWMGKRPQAEPKKKKFSVFPIIQAGGGEGVGLGFSFKVDDLFQVGDLYTDYTFFFDVENRANLAFTGNPIDLFGRPFQYEFVTFYRDRNEATYYGIGSDTSEDGGEYAYDQLTTGINLYYEVLPHLKVSLPLQFLTAKTYSADGGERPPVQDIFLPDELPGFDQRTNYFVTGLGISHDTRSDMMYPLKGGYRSFRFTRFQDVTSGSFSFNQYEIDIRQYIPLWAPRYVLMLRNDWVFQQSTGGGTIPFNLLADLDHYSPLRGFPVGRFRDESSVIFNMEYRFPVWSYSSIWTEKEGTFIDGLVFADTGRVFPGITDFSFDDWHYSAGGGLSIIVQNNFLMRLQAGYGGEGALIFFKMGGSL